jgi:hypothetical protein
MSFHPYMDNDSGGNPTPPLHLTRYSPWPEIITQGESNTLGNKRLQGWNKTNIAQAITGFLQAQIIMFCAAVDCYRLSRLQAQNIMYCTAVDSTCYRLSRLQAQNIMYCLAVDSACYRMSRLQAQNIMFCAALQALLATGSVGCRLRILCFVQHCRLSLLQDE